MIALKETKKTRSVKPKTRIVPHPRAKQLGIPSTVAVPRFMTTAEIQAVVEMKQTSHKRSSWEELIRVVVHGGEIYELHFA